MPRTHPLYDFILLAALGLLGSALYTLHRVRLSGEASPTQETFAVETPEQRDLGCRLDRLEKAYKKGDRREAFVLEQKLPKTSETALYQEFQSTNSLAHKIAILRALVQKSKKEDPPFFLNVWQTTKHTALKRTALMGLAKTNPKGVVEICEREIYGKKSLGILWKLYGTDALLAAKTAGAKGLLRKLAESSDREVALRAGRYLGFWEGSIRREGGNKTSPPQKNFPKTP